MPKSRDSSFFLQPRMVLSEGPDRTMCMNLPCSLVISACHWRPIGGDLLQLSSSGSRTSSSSASKSVIRSVREGGGGGGRRGGWGEVQQQHYVYFLFPRSWTKIFFCVPFHGSTSSLVCGGGGCLRSSVMSQSRNGC